MSKEKVYENIIKVLKNNNINFEEIEHEAVMTTEDSKRVRGENGWTTGIGSKNLIFHAKGKFYLVVTTAEKDIKARKFKKEFGTKDIRFAYDEEIDQLTGCERGAIPPFGYDNIELPIYFDEEVFGYEYFMFNPAIHTKSIRIKSTDMEIIYKNIINPISKFKITEEELVLKNIEK